MQQTLNRGRATRTWLGITLVLASSAIILAACSGSQKHAERAAKPPVVRDMPDVLRGTVGGNVTFNGIEPVLVSGFGIVVGLNGTGGGELPPTIQATMERDLARGNVTRGNAKQGELGKTPAEFLRDPNVAVVIVEASVPPGAPMASQFDVHVRALPNSSVTSLEGGTLWTTDLRFGPATAFTGVKTRIIGEARGQIFINPFTEPGSSTLDAVNRTSGRILNGGRVTSPLKIDLVLDNESHAMARAIVNAINTKFPKGPGDDDATAMGRDASSIAVRVPQLYKDKPAEFLELLRHTRIDQGLAAEWSCRYVDALKKQPELAESLGWCLRALGDPAVRAGCLSSMYDYPEVAPRMAALQAGAKLGDIRVVPYLQQVTLTGAPAFRVGAIELLGDMPVNPDINFGLHELLNAPELDIRVAAYEALAKRDDPLIDRIPVMGADLHRAMFLLDLVPSKEPLIYVTQQGEPRVVLFGGTGAGYGRRRDTLKLEKPSVVSAWTDRLMIASDSPTSPVRLFYRDLKTGQKTEQKDLPDQLAALILFMAHKPTPESPEPGLGLTYSEVVGALYEIQKQQGVAALFATETDRLQASVFEASNSTLVPERPEVAGATPDEKGDRATIYKPVKPVLGSEGPSDETPGSRHMVQPLTPKKKN